MLAEINKTVIPVDRKRVCLYVLILTTLIALCINGLFLIPTQNLKAMDLPMAVKLNTSIFGIILLLSASSGLLTKTKWYVDGQYLIFEQKFIIHTTRKVSFHDLSDYKTYSDPLSRLLGFGAIYISVSNGNQFNNVRIFGVIDHEKWRDELSRIDDEITNSANQSLKGRM